METFKIEVREFLSRIIEIEASSGEEAVSKVKAMYKNEEIVLDSEDYVATEIEEYDSELKLGNKKSNKKKDLRELKGKIRFADDYDYKKMRTGK
jgi:hypothetical protein